MKPDWFRHSVGPAAFAVFGFGRRMQHPLDEPIPGAGSLELESSDAALDRLISALLSFQQYTGELQPHFAFGELDKSAYAAAHAMHLNQHLSEIVIEG